MEWTEGKKVRWGLLAGPSSLEWGTRLARGLGRLRFQETVAGDRDACSATHGQGSHPWLISGWGGQSWTLPRPVPEAPSDRIVGPFGHPLPTKEGGVLAVGVGTCDV